LQIVHVLIFLFSSPGGDPLANIPDPVERFEDFPGVSEGLLHSFRQQGFAAPTPIQVGSLCRIRDIFCLDPYLIRITELRIRNTGYSIPPFLGTQSVVGPILDSFW
jgi:hypothetical protein